MNRPEGISESAWEKAVDLVMDAKAERVPYYSTSEEIRDARLADATAIALAIQSSVEAERARLLDGLARQADAVTDAMASERRKQMGRNGHGEWGYRDLWLAGVAAIRKGA